jgi:small GTP-binding protein
MYPEKSEKLTEHTPADGILTEKESPALTSTAEKLQHIAEFLNLKDTVAEIERIKARARQANAELILPLVGEFSSGKTTLINALTDSKKLETATKPTTSTLFEIHFGCERCYACIINKKGDYEEVEDISTLKNDALAETALVKVYDTSTRVHSTIVLVDTPGLSSPDLRHRQALVDFLPAADAVLLVTDINQQLTRSLTDFIDAIKLAKRPIYLIITKCDTKSKQELDQVKKYLTENNKLPVRQIICVSATADNLQEFYLLMDSIQTDKNNILKKVDQQRLKNTVNRLLQRIDELQKASSSDKNLEEAIYQQEDDLKRLNSNINKLIDSTTEEVKEKEKMITRQFEDIISDKLNALASGKSGDFDIEAQSIINNTASLLLHEFKVEIREALYRKAKERRNTDDAVTLNSLDGFDLSGLVISPLNYTLNLNELGHEYDSMIAGGVSTVSTVVGTAASIYFSGGATLAAAGASGGRALAVTGLRKGAALVGTGLLDNGISTVVSIVTDETMGRPQRKKAIRDYIDETLAPEFKLEMRRISLQLISSISSSLYNEAAESIEQKKTALQQLTTERKEKNEAYEERKKQLRTYKNELLTLKL